MQKSIYILALVLLCLSSQINAQWNQWHPRHPRHGRDRRDQTDQEDEEDQYNQNNQEDQENQENQGNQEDQDNQEDQEDEDNQGQPALVSATGTGEVRVVPDYAVVSVGVETRDPNLTTAALQTDAATAAIINDLKNQGIAEQDIQTSYISIQPYYAYDPNQPVKTQPDYYIASKTITFKQSNLADYDKIMIGLYNRGINSVNGITFGVTNEDEYKEQARELAVANAVQIATTLTAGVNALLGDIYSISENTYVPQPIAFEAFAESADASAPPSGPSIAAGVVVITSTVNVAFEIDQ